jgi:uncharacterized protein (TIGR03067 family)
MKWTIGLAMGVLLLVGADDKDKDKEKKSDDKPAAEKKSDDKKSDDKKSDDKKADDPLPGTWKVVALSTNGKEDGVTPNHTLTFSKGNLITKVNDKPLGRSRYKVDPTQKPAAIDVTIIGGFAAGKVLKGIYQLKDDDLKYAIAMSDGEDRPTDFEHKKFVTIYTLKRVKPAQ